jgi:hypothetical protein
MPDDKSQGIVRDQRGEEQPADKDRAQKASKTEPGHMPSQPVTKKDEKEKWVNSAINSQGKPNRSSPR